MKRDAAPQNLAPTNADAETLRPNYTPNEVAGVLRMHPVYVRSLFARGAFPGAIRIGSRWLLPARHLHAILQTGLATSKKEAAR